MKVKLLGLMGLSVWGMGVMGQAVKPYFQQKVAYEIHVKLDDVGHYLRGKETILYTNNSPDTLDAVAMHLWPNAYSSEQSAFGKQKLEDGSLRFRNSKPEERGGIDSLAFTVDGAAVTYGYWKNEVDVAVLKLVKPIPPGATVKIETPFRVKIPTSFSRLGHIDQQYQLCQWYPKPAVYDREGWHPMPYLDQGEFYSEFGSYDVHITVPKNYVVGATGDLPKNDPEWAWIKAREAKSRELLEKPLGEAFFPAEFPDTEMKTLHFHQENVHDFAWFCDKSYYILADTFKMPQSGREVRCVAMFTALDRDLWKEAPRYVGQALYYYSLWNGDYPYNHATAVDGALSAGAGMEYPNITVLGAGGSARSLETVTMHEVGHNWYYGMLGSNEREYPWMDEGLNTYFEGKYWKVVHGDSMDMIPPAMQQALGINFTHTFMAQASYEFAAGQGTDQPIQLHAADYSSLNYGIIAYMKSGLAFNYLEAYLGEEVTDRCFHAYFEKWKFKHPGPDDIQAVFEEVSGKDLDWFFNVYLLGVHKLDFRIQNIKGDAITVRNRSSIPLPAAVQVTDKEGNVLGTYWSEPFVGTTVITVPGEGFHAARVNPDNIAPELRNENNGMRAKGLLRHSKPLNVDFGYKYPDPTKANLYFLPVIGANTTDGFMGGLLVHSGFYPKRKYEFHVMPMYGFKSKGFVGSAGFTARWHPSRWFSKIELHGRVSSFATLLRVKPYVVFDVRPREMRSPWRHSVTLASHVVADRGAEYALAPDDWYLPVYGSGVWKVKGDGTLGDFASRVEVGGNTAQRMARISGEASYTRKVGKNAEAYVRGFAGGILSPDPQPYMLQYRVSGSGDPFGEHILLDRAQSSNSFLARQLIRDHGQFSSVVDGSFDKGLLALNAHFKLPVPLVSVFGDVAYGMGSAGNGSFYDAGVRLNLLKEVLHVNVPVVGTTFGGTPASGEDFLRGINFSFDPVRLVQSLGDVVQGAD